MWKLKIAEGRDDKWLRTVNNHIGRQHWVFDPDAGTQEEIAEVERLRQEFTTNRFHVKQSSDLLMRMQLAKENPRSQIPPAHRVEDGEKVTEEAVTATLRRGVGFYSSVQADDGHWPAESAGPTFFLPPIVIVLYVTGELNTILTSEHQKEIIRYTYNHQNEDGGWGFHIEGHSTMFGTVLSYVILRLLGQLPNDGDVENAMTKARKWILAHGGATGTPTWGKFWITLLGIYDWDGCNPIPPEFLLLPNSFPVHPGKMLCYCRLVFIPMSYLYGKRFVGPITDLVRSIRQELYTEPYEKINWNKARNTCAKEDLYYPHPAIQDMAWGLLRNVAEPFLKWWPFSWVREKAMKVAMEHIHYEDENSRYLCIGCVEKTLSLMACWVEDPNSDAYKLHLARLPDYLWLAEDGLKFQSFGSQMWDASFAIQAILSGNISHEYSKTIRKAHDFLKATQMREDPPGNFTKMYRHLSKGGWPFSIQDHGWQVSDCTAEGLKAALLLSQMPSDLVGQEFELQNLQDSVNIIISLQSPCGGLPAWEPQKAFRWMEYFNPTEFFEDVMIEKEYVECTSSAIQALVLFKKLHPGHRKKEIEICISKAIDYIKNNQNSDGSWYGCWGICYTYGTWFGIKGLVASGRNYHNSSTVRKACHFLLSKQLEDGGWGESYHSCTDMVYTNLENNQSNLVQTSWALMSLIDAGQTKIDPEPVNKGIRLLINSQMQDGDFPQQSITGIFMKNCTLNYSSYRNIFPIWALGEYRKQVLFA